MIELEYLKRSKEEITKSIIIYKNLNELNIKNLIFHMEKSMLFLIDAIMKKHTDLINDLNDSKKKIDKILDKDFFETLFLIKNMNNKKIKILKKNKAIIIGKNSYKIEITYFGKLLVKIINYFNKIYKKTELGDL